MVACKLVKEMLRIELTNSSLLVDLLNVEGARWAIRVPDLEINGVYRTFPKVSKGRKLPPGGSAWCPWSIMDVVLVVIVSGRW